ncbi:endonuclease/exonuclease/phosphatase family protein [Paraglaciecola chathamensis]|uniref:Endonuclease/exonuclease/phosphatase family protein n=1 Tax=Paraglaciecola chathamensis TaxID=368405 RepID=A0ABS0WKM3_9ALTE|nr:endonuclease/exonuclease/phosphatase family protein [Paraglaciecola chathamensis]MBJ2139027.1 endonuclease/exonuclease/phosphatase family protein [Paraglaciecola chathamensis]
MRIGITSIAALSAGCSTHNTASDLANQNALGQAGSEVMVASEQRSHEINAFKVATWNMEHFAYPIDTGCRPRTSDEIAAMKAYVAGVGANVIALQEVASTQALSLLFPESEWDLVFSGRSDSPAYECRESGFTSTQQKVAFAIRKGTQILDVQQNDQLALHKIGLRYGLAVTLETPLGPTAILNVHLKSGCFVDDYTASDKGSCQALAQQVPVLERWLAEHQSLAMPYMVLGDFNHRLASADNYLASRLTSEKYHVDIATQHLDGCHPRYPEPIDHILIGGVKAASITSTAQVYKYEGMDGNTQHEKSVKAQEEAMLSDHCALAVTLM